MDISDTTKILLMVAVAMVAFYFYTNKKSYKKSGYMKRDSERKRQAVYEHFDQETGETKQEEISSESELEQEESEFLKKMRNKNSGRGKYKRSNYRDGVRPGDSSDLDKFFEEGTQFEENENNFAASNDSSANFASYTPGDKKKSKRDEDNYNSGDFLPKETNNDWFEDVQAVSVKNRHLINVYRPVGVDTTSSSRKNASLDIRGTPPNPKTVVSPFLNSSIEPDHNIRSMC